MKLNKILIVVTLLLAVALSACSLVDDYLPADNTSSELNDTFVFTNNTTEDTNVSLESNATQDVEEKEDIPVFASITVTEGDLVSLADIYAIDPDGDSVDYTYEDPFNEAGLWQTNDGDEGKYLTTVGATDGMLSTVEQLQIVVKPSNKAPVITCKDSYEFAEGDFIDLACNIYDKEGDEVTFSVSGFMDELTYQTTYEDAGNHTVVISASDGNRVATKEIELLIQDTNRPPELVGTLEPINATELDTITLDLEVADPDGDEVNITYPVMFGEDAQWTPKRGDEGTYEVEVILSDGESEVSVPVSIIVNKVNLPPEFAPIDPITVYEGDVIELPVNITDDEEVVVSYSGFTGGRIYQTTYDDAGEHEVIMTASDGVHQVQEVVHITVLNVNRPPVFVDE